LKKKDLSIKELKQDVTPTGKEVKVKEKRITKNCSEKGRLRPNYHPCTSSSLIVGEATPWFLSLADARWNILRKPIARGYMQLHGRTMHHHKCLFSPLAL